MMKMRTETTYKLHWPDIIAMVRAYLECPKTGIEVSFKIPGGGDWSNTYIDQDDELFSMYVKIIEEKESS